MKKKIELNDRDIFILAYGIFLIMSWVFRISIFPFRFSSLLVIFLFLIITRSLAFENKIDSLILVGVFGLIFSLFLSVYGLAIYFLISIYVLKKTNLL